ncbi:MAG: OmpP1/FadL family transporter [Gammaproteobacteria bacterium]
MYYHRIVAGALLAFTHTAFSSGFALHEQNASGLGEFYAGAGAIAEEASTNYYNPAGLVLLPGTQISISGVNVMSAFTFEGDTEYQTGIGAPYPPTALYSAEGSTAAGTSRLVPAVHISHRFTDQIAAGFSVTAPFGLATEYSDESIARYQAIESDMYTLNIGPSLAFRVLPWLSLAAGFDAQYAELKVSSAVNYAFGYEPSPETDNISKNHATSWAWGWHAAAMAIISPQSHVGLNYRSNFEHDFSGNSRFKDADGNLITDSHVSGTADFPWLVDLSGSHAFNDKWTVLGSVAYTNWSSISALTLDNVATSIAGHNATGTSTDPLNYENSWSAFAGLRYQYNPYVMFKVGGGYDQSPTQDEDRDLRLPDSNRWIASAGIRVIPPQVKNLSLDLAYARIFANDAPIEKSLEDETTVTNTADGTVTGHADLIGAQISLRI